MNELEISLREIGNTSGKTESEVDAALATAMRELSKRDARDGALLPALQEHVKILGGEVELWAVFGDKRVRVRGV